jgi:hypothetical protein
VHVGVQGGGLAAQQCDVSLLGGHAAYLLDPLETVIARAVELVADLRSELEAVQAPSPGCLHLAGLPGRSPAASRSRRSAHCCSGGASGPGGIDAAAGRAGSGRLAWRASWILSIRT